jgi:5,10-methylenetetrahydrofolate reductase
VFELLVEVAPPRRPDLTSIGPRLDALAPLADTFLVTDSPLGRPAVSALAVAAVVAARGGAPAAVCLNARDRNLTGLRRDLLTAAAVGVGRVLCVFGDAPAAGARTDDLSVPVMLGETSAAGLEAGVSASISAPLPAWKRRAAFVVTQLSFDASALARWRDANDATADVYAGVMVATPRSQVPGVDIPERLRAPAAAVEHAVTMIDELCNHGGFAGVHLVVPPVHTQALAGAVSPRRRFACA